MVLSNDLPTDSVLRRHAVTEKQRILGLPPTDSVLRRHYEQLQAALQDGGQADAAAARVAPRASTAGPTASTARTTAATPSASGGGLMGWLRRLFGG
jgi:hypothetical protein